MVRWKWLDPVNDYSLMSSIRTSTEAKFAVGFISAFIGMFALGIPLSFGLGGGAFFPWAPLGSVISVAITISFFQFSQRLHENWGLDSTKIRAVKDYDNLSNRAKVEVGDRKTFVKIVKAANHNQTRAIRQRLEALSQAVSARDYEIKKTLPPESPVEPTAAERMAQEFIGELEDRAEAISQVALEMRRK